MEHPILADLRSKRGILWTAAAAALIAAVVMALQPKPVITRKDAAKAAQAGSATSLPPEATLAPGEALVQSRTQSGPLMPHYSQPDPPSAADTVPDRPQPPEAVSAEARAELQRAASTPEAPAPMASTEPARDEPARVAAPRIEPPRADAPRTEATRGAPLVTWSNPPTSTFCRYCGEVTSVTVWPDMAEVRVRFQDGSSRTLRSDVPNHWLVGDTVRVERGRLVRD